MKCVTGIRQYRVDAVEGPAEVLRGKEEKNGERDETSTHHAQENQYK